MILSNIALHEALDQGRIVIDPEPGPRLPTVKGGHCPFDTHSVDVRLSDELVLPTTGMFSYNLTFPGAIAHEIEKHSERRTITRDQPYQLEPHKFVLGKTLERIRLPIDVEQDTCLAARIEGKSSRARFGILVHFTAPTVHPGFEGHLTLEMINLGPAVFQLVPGMYIAQLIVEEVRGCPNLNPSQFQGQVTAAGSANAERPRRKP